MIKSVTFPLEGVGYIYKKVEKPEKPKKENRYRKTSYDEEMEAYKKKLSFYKKHKDEFVLPASKNLVGKTFEFQDGKINVLFGPNACGKTTILKAIAGTAMIEDGFTSFRKPIEFGLFEMKRNIQSIVDELKKNSSVVEWDGTPIYYDNFDKTRANSYGMFGNLVGSALQDLRDEIEYHMTSKRISAGQNTLYITNKILRICQEPISMKSLCDNQIKKFTGCNETWKKTGKTNYEYFSSYEGFEKEIYPTLVFDEMDKSLDIETVWKLYTEFLPVLVEKYKNQIILVSHSPLILTETIFNNPSYNIVSVDEDYTNSIKETLKNVKF